MARPRMFEPTTSLVCAECSTSFTKPTKEVRRQTKTGRTHFFCSGECAARYNMRTTGRTKPVVEKVCPTCGVTFQASTRVRGATHCSRSCASSGSVTPHRRARARETGLPNLQHDTSTIAASLRSREGWKYQGMVTVLTHLGVSHTFEFPLDPYVYDLALHDTKTLVEFDGPGHLSDTEVQALDALKTQHAHQLGWKLERIAVEPAAPIPPSKIRHLL